MNYIAEKADVYMSSAIGRQDSKDYAQTLSRELIKIAFNVKSEKSVDKMLDVLMDDTEGRWSMNQIGNAKSLENRIFAAMELCRRYLTPRRTKITSPCDVYPIVRHYAMSEQEVFVVVMLDGSHSVIGTELITVGLANKTLVHPREVFSEAIKQRATAVILVHNHPSDNLDPSPDDLEVTKEQCAAGRIVGIKVLDHLVIGRTSFISMMEKGFMPSEV
ncbi:MAG: JAB domain-containing protein [Sphaerochaetaceae bacterium]